MWRSSNASWPTPRDKVRGPASYPHLEEKGVLLERHALSISTVFLTTSRCVASSEDKDLLAEEIMPDVVEEDPVCGVAVDPLKAAGYSEYEGKTYYFCCPGCKQKFDLDPADYADFAA
jgi:YHS domain-containing protein